MLRLSDPILIASLLRKIARSLKINETDHNRMVNAQAMRLWETFAKLAADRNRRNLLSALPAWAQSSALPSQWRLNQIEALLASGDDGEYDRWRLVQGLVERGESDRKRSLRLLELLARAGGEESLTGIQLHAVALLKTAAKGDPDEAHLARSINSVLVTKSSRRFTGDG